MSDLDGLIFNFDEVQGVLPSDTPGFKPFERVEFACYQLVGDIKSVNKKEGEPVTLENVIINGQPYTSPLYKQGGKSRVMFVKVTKWNANGEPYDRIEGFDTNTSKYDAATIAELKNIALDDRQQKSFKENSTAYLSALSNMFIPSVQKMAKRADFGHGKPLYAMVKRMVYNSRPNNDSNGMQKVDESGRPQYWYDSYPYEFVKYFDNAEQLRAAANQYYEDLRKQRENGASGIMYPATWKNSLDAMKDYAKKVWSETNSRDEVQKKLSLTPDMVDEKGNPVDVEAILNALTDTAF